MLWGMTLDPETKARIEAEERYRAEVRGAVQQEQARAAPPSYWLGFILNLLLTGLGFAVMGETLVAFMWIIVAILTAIWTGFVLSPLVVILALVHYHHLYKEKYT